MTEQSQIGLVYVPIHGVEIDENACIRYERYPWIEKFELDGIRPAAVCCIWQPGGDSRAEASDSSIKNIGSHQ